MRSADYARLLVTPDRIPEFRSWDFRCILERARACLAHRLVEELTEKEHDLDILIINAQPWLLLPDEEEPENAPYETLPAALFRLRTDIPLDPVSDLHWSEYFALLALKGICDTRLHESIFKHFRETEEITDEQLYDTLAFRALQTMEAVGYAERLACEERLNQTAQELGESQANQAIRARNRLAAYERNRPYIELREEFVAYYLAGRYPSMRNAAERFYKGLPEPRQIYCSTEHAIRNLTDYLRQFRNR